MRDARSGLLTGIDATHRRHSPAPRARSTACGCSSGCASWTSRRISSSAAGARGRWCTRRRTRASTSSRWPPRVPARRHGRGDLERVVQDRRHDRRAVQRQDAGGHRAWLRRQPDSPRGRRDPQGTPHAGARRPRSAAQRHSSREHAEAVAHGRRHPAADAGVLQPPADDRRPRRSHRRAHARSRSGWRCRAPCAGPARWASQRETRRLVRRLSSRGPARVPLHPTA